jgi:hypothetical protein
MLTAAIITDVAGYAIGTLQIFRLRAAGAALRPKRPLHEMAWQAWLRRRCLSSTGAEPVRAGSATSGNVK